MLLDVLLVPTLVLLAAVLTAAVASVMDSGLVAGATRMTRPLPWIAMARMVRALILAGTMPVLVSPPTHVHE